MLKDKVKLAVDWFNDSTSGTQIRAFEELVEFAIMSEFINVWSESERQNLAEEEGIHNDFSAPYFTTTGEKLGD